MDEHKKEDIEYELADVIIGTPHEFTLNDKQKFCLYPVTLAKMFLMKRNMDLLGFNSEIAKMNPYMEAVRLVKEHKEECCRIIALHTAPNTYKDLFDFEASERRYQAFMKEADDEDLTQLMIYVLTWDKTDKFMKHIGLDKEAERRRKIMEVKKDDKHNVSFGGLSLFGSFIGQLKEMGYSDDEILYEKSYCYLRMMLADKTMSLFLSDEDLKKLPNDIGGAMIDANDPNAMEKLQGRLAGRGVKFK